MLQKAIDIKKVNLLKSAFSVKNKTKQLHINGLGLLFWL